MIKVLKKLTKWVLLPLLVLSLTHIAAGRIVKLRIDGLAAEITDSYRSGDDEKVSERLSKLSDLYEFGRDFGFDTWTHLTQNVLESTMGYNHPEEYDRILTGWDYDYDRDVDSFIDTLSEHSEGLSLSRSLSRQGDPGLSLVFAPAIFIRDLATLV